MPTTTRFAERIGRVFLPEADLIDSSEDFTPNPEGPLPVPGIPGWPFEPRLPFKWPPAIEPNVPRICLTNLKEGCYSLRFTPKGSTIRATRYRGTLRVERHGGKLRFSGDLYTRRLFDDLLQTRVSLATYGRMLGGDAADDSDDPALDAGGTIPIYSRASYRSYLKGTSARLFSVVSLGSKCSFTLNFDEFVYNHPATGFSGSFNTAPTRSIRYVLRPTGTADSYSGEAYQGHTLLGTVAITWLSPFFRRAALQLHTLDGFEAPPAAVGTSTFASIFADAGWDVSFADGGTVALPAALAAVDPLLCWSHANLHTLMSSVPGYNPADLDSVWRVHLVSVPAELDCSRGVMFDSSLGADPNSVPREGSATFSRDGYPSTDTVHYDTAADQEQRNVPRAFLRSATHEVGHAFNQIHQGFELGSDNSIMTPTPSVANVLGTAGTFPDDINLGFNDTVKRHLRHLPDPAVRPGAMDFFGSAISAPEASDVAWPDTLALAVTSASDQVHLGEPVEVTFELKNTGEVAVPVPETLDLSSLTVRINVTEPGGRITFMRPARVESCPKLGLRELAPGKSVKGSATVYWGRDGFAFETPGRHLLEVIVLWDVGGVPVAASGTRDLFVNYPISRADNEVAALLLDPEVGKAIASGRAWLFEGAAARIKRAAGISRSHPANKAVAKVAVLQAPRPPKRSRSNRKAAGRSRGRKKG
ncbi:MAG: hypothetical protein HOP28_07925 [Gemmatimonadales bacterium]|nr:hypothetical protein [Gemmatimonadales bacterium]